MGSVKSNIMVKQEGVIADFICYNDANFPPRTASFTPRMVSKIPKMLGWLLHPSYDYYIWIDSDMNMNRPDAVAWFIENINSHDVLFFKHPERSSIKDEIDFIKKQVNAGNEKLQKKVLNEPIEKQVEKYLYDDKFIDNVLIAAGAFCYSRDVVKNTEDNFMKAWFFETCFWSIRDQLSLPYVIQKYRVNYKLIAENIYKHKYLK